MARQGDGNFDDIKLGQSRDHSPEVEGHVYRSWSDERLKQAIQQAEGAVSTLRTLDSPPAQSDSGDGEVEGQAFRSWSDERLKQAIQQTQGAVTTLRRLHTTDVQPDTARYRPARSPTTSWSVHG